LIHYNVWGKDDYSNLLEEAATTFSGPLFLCEDMQEIPLDTD
jgi:hypothetical protein